MTKRILVTGGAGYVGSHACKAFAQAGWDVTVYDNLSRGWRDLVRWGDLIEADLQDVDALKTAFDTVQPHAVAHFAAFAYVGESMTDPGMYYQNNVVGTLNLLKAMNAAGCSSLLFSSSCATYGKTDEPITEDTFQAPINPYGMTKLMGERMILDYAMAHGLKYMILRYFNASGCDADGETGERHDPEPHVIPLAIRGAMDGSFTFTINGNDFPTRDGTCVRDYIHVTDLAAAHQLAVDRLHAGGESDILNLGTGTGTSILELADAVKKRAGKDMPTIFGDRRPGDPPSLVASADKVKRVLGWKPKHSSIDNIVDTAWRWFEQEAKREQGS